MNKKILLIFFLLTIPLVFADIAPIIPVIDTREGFTLDIFYNYEPQNVSMILLHCGTQIKYDEIVDALYDSYIDSKRAEFKWYDMCDEIASEYGFSKEDCTRGIQFSLIERKQNFAPISELSEKIKDEEKGCYWIPSLISDECIDGKCKPFFKIMYLRGSEYKIGVHFEDINKTFYTEPIEINFYDTKYILNFNSDGSYTIQEENMNIINKNNLMIALLMTIILELIIAFIFLKKRKISMKVLFSVILASLITLPILWNLIPQRSSILFFFFILILLEKIIILFEGILIFFLNKKRITIKDSLYLSTLMNIVSFIIGSIIFLALFG
jgi:hypothetical protein